MLISVLSYQAAYLKLHSRSKTLRFRQYPGFNNRRSTLRSIQCVVEKVNSVQVNNKDKIGHLGKNVSEDEHLLDIDQDELIAEVNLLLELLPQQVSQGVREKGDIRQLLEVVLDLGRPPLARYNQGDQVVRNEAVSSEDLEIAIEGLTQFGGDNRAGINGTLHRISAIRNRQGRIIGLTCRVGRAVRGSAKMISDFINEKKSILLLGPPGVGKTTVIRDVSRMLADPPMERRVVIVDTSNEIGGDGDVPHLGIGRSRRMQVPHPLEQHKIMIEAVENHMPEVIIIDEIGTVDETAAARTISQRGVQLIGTAHGNKLENLIKNPSLQDLVGGIQSVTLGDDTAKKRGVQKSILERKGPPSFDVCVEIVERGTWVVHPSVGQSVDALLQGKRPQTQIRKRANNEKGYDLSHKKREQQEKKREKQEQKVIEQTTNADFQGAEEEVEDDEEEYEYEEEEDSEFYEDEEEEEEDDYYQVLKILPFKLKRATLEQALQGNDFKFQITDKKNEADAAIGVRDELRTATHFRREMRLYGVPVYGMKTNSISNLIKALNVVWKQHRLQQESDEEEQHYEEEQEEEDDEEDQNIENQSDNISNNESSQVMEHTTQHDVSESETQAPQKDSNINSEISDQSNDANFETKNSDVQDGNLEQSTSENSESTSIPEFGQELIREFQQLWGLKGETAEQSLRSYKYIFGDSLSIEECRAFLEVETVVSGRLSSDNVVGLTPQKSSLVDKQIQLVKRYNVYYQRSEVDTSRDRLVLSKKVFIGSQQ